MWRPGTADELELGLELTPNSLEQQLAAHRYNPLDPVGGVSPQGQPYASHKVDLLSTLLCFMFLVFFFSFYFWNYTDKCQASYTRYHRF